MRICNGSRSLSTIGGCTVGGGGGGEAPGAVGKGLAAIGFVDGREVARGGGFVDAVLGGFDGEGLCDGEGLFAASLGAAGLMAGRGFPKDLNCSAGVG